MKVFLLAGQSNMQGFGEIAGHPVLHDPRIFNLATGNAEVAVEPLHHWAEHPYMPDGIGLGLAMPFALEILKAYPDIRIGFIPAARGGSSLDQWQPGNENFERAMWLFERAAKNHPDVEVGGILWHQGESDSGTAETATTYGERFLRTINGFRERLGAPGAPVVAGELGRSLLFNPHCRECATVVSQTKAAITSLKNAAFATSEDLVCEGVHFNTEAIRSFGLRYAEAYLNIFTIIL
ncbi:MAG: sialate O-acetylesterase [Terrimicrobiaceae bacterium]